MPRKLKAGVVVLAVMGSLWLSFALHPRAHAPQHDHSHCIKVAMGLLQEYAAQHGHFPYSTNGYGDALLLVTTNKLDFWFLTAQGYDEKIFEHALEHGTQVSERECGRVYVQGVPSDKQGDIALLFDKRSRKGGREIDEALFIKDADWPAFAKQQIELLVAAGISRRQAESYYAEAK